MPCRAPCGTLGIFPLWSLMGPGGKGASGGLEKPRDWGWTSKFKWPLLGPHAPSYKLRRLHIIWMVKPFTHHSAAPGVLGPQDGPRTPGTHSRGKRRMESRRSQEEPRGARRSREQPAAARGEPGGARRSQTNRLASHTDCPGQAQAALLIAGTPSHLQGIKAKQAPQHGWTSLPGPVGQTVPWPKG